MTTMHARPATRRRRLKPEARRDQIVETATRLVVEQGYASVTLSAIADEVGVQKSSVLHHFPSMAHIMCAVLERRDLEEPFPIENGHLRLDPSDARAVITSVFLRNLQQPELIRLYAVLGVEAMDESHPAHAFFVERSENGRQFLAELLRWRADPDASAVELIAFWQGLETEILRIKDLDYMAVWNSFCDQFFEGALRRSRPTWPTSRSATS